MGFSDKQLRALARNVPARAIRSRMLAGRELSYIEGWYAVSQANRIFGFDGWDRETVETKCVLAREVRGTLTALYCARVRITVRTGDGVIVRDGHGTGEAQGASAGEAHDRALKAAETDATKRALATFGKAFGLALYANGRRPARPAAPHEPEQATQQPPLQSPRLNGAIKASPGATPGTERLAAQASPAATPMDRSGKPGTGLERDTAAGNIEGPAKSENGHDPAAADTRAAKKTGGRSDALGLLNGASTRLGIAKAALAIPEPHRIRDKHHLRFVASQPCLLCGATPSDPHHVRFAQPRAMSRKVGDDFTVPLCRAHHRELHRCGNESAFWHDLGVDPLEIARQLWEESEERRGDLALQPRKTPGAARR